MSDLMLHAGARQVSRTDLALVPTPEPTKSWFPVGHLAVIETVESFLDTAGFSIERSQYGLSRSDGRMFATLDLASPMTVGVKLSVGVRNSIDKSLPIGFCAGNRVFVCDNLSFSSELLVTRKHTRFGNDRFREAISLAVGKLGQFRAIETNRIARFQDLQLTDQRAESLILRAYESDLVSHLALPAIIQEWRRPSFEEFTPRTAWSLFNAFTMALGKKASSNPQAYANTTMQLSSMLDFDHPVVNAFEQESGFTNFDPGFIEVIDV
jgi:Domain of unknown function (DUF932)